MQIGITLPTFRADATTALEVAAEAEGAGLHGVFSFDHLWPIGEPDKASLSCMPMLAAVAATTGRIHLGPLVARIGLVPDEVLYASLRGLQAIGGRRLYAGLGLGDKKSHEEQLRIGVPVLGAAERRRSLAKMCARLAAAGIGVFCGAGDGATNSVARSAGASLNFWRATPEKLAAERTEGAVSFAGPLPAEVGDAAAALAALATAGAEWAIWAWPRSVDDVASAARLAGIALEA